MKIIAIIPARGHSKGILRKNLRLLGDKPLIAHAILTACQAVCVDRVFVSTDDPEIASVAKNFDSEIVMRPETISGDTASSEAALLHVSPSHARSLGILGVEIGVGFAVMSVMYSIFLDISTGGVLPEDEEE